MKPKDFFDAVVRMREKQREYFKTKTSSCLLYTSPSPRDCS